jgi:diguanylate cyclase (GGDEF)-like protein
LLIVVSSQVRATNASRFDGKRQPADYFHAGFAGRRARCAAKRPVVVEWGLLSPITMSSTSDHEPGWFRCLSRVVLRMGLTRSMLAMTALVTLLAVLIAQLVIMVLGRGDRMIAAASATLCSVVLTPMIGSVVLRLVFELDRTRQRLTVLATHDDLTGVHNRRHFMEVVQGEWDRARRYAVPAALLLIDADHFKRVNDAHGHLCGDELLRCIAQTVREQLRQADVLARFGGEELIVFLPHTDPLGALDVAERIREKVQALSVPWHAAAVNTTVSIGVAPLRNELPSLDWMIHEADTALYAAKADGRNCVRTLPFEPSRSGGAYSVNSR